MEMWIYDDGVDAAAATDDDDLMIQTSCGR